MDRSSGVSGSAKQHSGITAAASQYCRRTIIISKGGEYMDGNVIYSDEYIKIFTSNNDVLAETYKKGFSVEQLFPVLEKHPQVTVTNMDTLRSLLLAAPAGPKKIGEFRNRIQLEIFPDVLTATITFYMTKEELSRIPADNLRVAVESLLKQNGVVFGINLDFLYGELEPFRPYTAARGIPAEDGKDAVIKMYELAEAKPQVAEGGKVDFYEMKLINRVKPGDWLGERIEATEGTPGKNVKGEVIEPVKGKTAPLLYDKRTVEELQTPGKTVLVSRINGAVNYEDGRISVSNHLEINGDAGVATGNIKFDGYVTIHGTINDGYSVEATNDIEINSPYGLGNVKSITSTNGSIYIKGGVSSKNRVEIIAGKNVYVKFADNARIVCGGEAHIGYYCINSEIVAKGVLFDSFNGQVIGGNIRAEVYISVPVCGSEIERKTVLEVTGFNRQALVRRLDELFLEISSKKLELQKLKSHPSETSYLSEKLARLREELRTLEEERKLIAMYLNKKGDGEISITKRIYPNSYIILGDMYADAEPQAMPQTFYLKDGEIKKL